MNEPDAPTEGDWDGYELSADSTWAHGQFFNKTPYELGELFNSNPVEAAENIFRIPEKALSYYFFQFGLYVKSVVHSDDLSKSDAASAFLNYLLAISREKPAAIKAIAPLLLGVAEFVAAHQVDYFADEEIYGSFRERYQFSKKNLGSF